MSRQCVAAYRLNFAKLAKIYFKGNSVSCLEVECSTPSFNFIKRKKIPHLTDIR